MPIASGPFDPRERGFHAVYRDGETNHCPGCGRTHWLIGRSTAECAFCSTAVPLGDGVNRKADRRPEFFKRGRGGGRTR